MGGGAAGVAAKTAAPHAAAHTLVAKMLICFIDVPPSKQRLSNGLALPSIPC
jgi:hypothetical protein